MKTVSIAAARVRAAIAAQMACATAARVESTAHPGREVEVVVDRALATATRALAIAVSDHPTVVVMCASTLSRGCAWPVLARRRDVTTTLPVGKPMATVGAFTTRAFATSIALRVCQTSTRRCVPLWQRLICARRLRGAALVVESRARAEVRFAARWRRLMPCATQVVRTAAMTASSAASVANAC